MMSLFQRARGASVTYTRSSPRMGKRWVSNMAAGSLRLMVKTRSGLPLRKTKIPEGSERRSSSPVAAPIALLRWDEERKGAPTLGQIGADSPVFPDYRREIDRICEEEFIALIS